MAALRSAAATNQVFVPPLLAQHATFSLLTRDAGFRSFDNGEVVVLPARDPQRGMLYAFTADADPAYLEEFERTYGSLAQRSTVPDMFGKPLLIEYRIAPDDIPPRERHCPPRCRSRRRGWSMPISIMRFAWSGIGLQRRLPAASPIN